MRGVLFEADTLHIDGVNQLKAFFDDWSVYKAGTSEDLLNDAVDADVVFVNKIKITGEMMGKLPKLRLICITATGTDNVDLDAAKEKNIPVINAGTYSTKSVAQHAMALILALTGRLVENREAIAKGDWHKSPFFCLTEYYPLSLENKKLGIIGYGNIGKEVARLAECFGMQVLISGHRNPAPDRIPLKELLEQVDVLSLHCPLTEETRNMIGEKEFELMKDTSILINVSRGGIVDERALVKALSENQIFGAGLDVLQAEPPPVDDSLVKLNHPRLLITPHIAWAERESQRQLIQNISEKLKAFINEKG